jgi:beta-lactamase regulating signal transducer with metallopeptidase domain
MHEQLAPVAYFVEVHLLCASLVCLGAWLLSSLSAVSASTKYWIWLLASLNFALPVGGLIDGFGATEIAAASQLNLLAAGALGIARQGSVVAILVGVWMLGTVAMAIRLARRIRAGRGEGILAGTARREFRLQGVAVQFGAAHGGPLVEGLIRTRIRLPEGIEQLLTPPEFAAVLRHELTHAKRRDNLLQLGYELVLCLLWFHPLLWLSGGRLALYRELSCDDAAMRAAPGRHLVDALAKLACPERSSLLRAAAASQILPRLQRLLAPRPVSGPLNAFAVAVFALLLLSGIGLTIVHTACCLVPQP